MICVTIGEIGRGCRRFATSLSGGRYELRCVCRLSNKTALAMIFKLAEAAEKSWRRLDGHNQLPKVISGVNFADGIEVVRSQVSSRCRLTLLSPRFGDSSLSRRVLY